LVKDKAQITQQKILESATEIFSEKGFDGARVNEIASRANINKAMIYYYFESKENLFAEIIKGFFRECDVLKLELKNEISMMKNTDSEKYFDKVEKFLNGKKSLIKIILIDSIKSNSNDISALATIMPILEDRKEDFKYYKLSKDELTQQLINRFFFITIPWIIFLIIGERWGQFFEIDRNIAKKSFMKVFAQYRDEYYNSL